MEPLETQTGMHKTFELPIRHCSRKRGPGALASLLLAAISCLAQPPSVVKDANAYNRPVLLVGNDKLEVAIVKQGGSMLRIQIQGDPQGIARSVIPNSCQAFPTTASSTVPW